MKYLFCGFFAGMAAISFMLWQDSRPAGVFVFAVLMVYIGVTL